MRNSKDETTSKKGRHDSDPKSDNSVFWSDDETATTVANDDTDRFVKPVDTWQWPDIECLGQASACDRIT